MTESVIMLHSITSMVKYSVMVQRNGPKTAGVVHVRYRKSNRSNPTVSARRPSAGGAAGSGAPGKYGVLQPCGCPKAASLSLVGSPARITQGLALKARQKKPGD